MTPSLPPRIDPPWLKTPARVRVFAALAAKGHMARAVGGAVRNTLLGAPVHDVDIATTATPPDIIAAAREAGLAALPTGIAHGTVTIVCDGISTEVTTLRCDVESDGRHARVAFTDDWLQDAARRDFTMNALYCDADGTVFDPLGGYPDLLARRVRFIGDAVQRIREDYLRVLRFFRFNAQHGAGCVDATGLAACVAERDGLVRLSGERVQQELQRLLVAPRALALTQVMFEHGLLVRVLGRAPSLAMLARMAACEDAFAAVPDFARRLAALVVRVGEDADDLQARLKLSNAVTARLRIAAETPAAPDAPTARQWLYRTDADRYRDAILAACARLAPPVDLDDWRAIYDLPARWQPPRFPLGGRDAQAAGVAPGPAVGRALRAVEEAWIASDFTLSHSALLTLLATKAQA